MYWGRIPQKRMRQLWDKGQIKPKKCSVYPITIVKKEIKWDSLAFS